MSLSWIAGFARRLWVELFSRRNTSPGWLSQEVHSIMEGARKNRRSVPFKERLRKLALPEWKPTGLMLSGLVISLLVITLGLSSWNPPIPGLPGEERLLSVYATMWQVQAGIAVVALPILLFVIQLSKDQREVAARTHEVLIRETYIFPIVVFALAGTVRIGVDIAWFPNEAVFATDFAIVFVGTLLLTVYAYFSALRLLFSPSTMKARGRAVAKEKMYESLDASIAIRVGNKHLFSKLKDLNIGFWPLAPESHEVHQYLILTAPNGGFLADIHLGKLEEFIIGLPWKEQVRAGLSSEPEPELEEGGKQIRNQREQHVWLMRRYGERIGSRRDGLMRLKIDAFDNLDPAALEARLKSVVKVRPEMDTEGKDLKSEFSYLKDNLIEGIKQGRTALVRDGLEKYEELVSAFIDALKGYGSTYDKERAMRELTALEGGWSEIEWINDDLREIIDATMNVPNINVILDVIFFPIRLASLAFRELDYYIFYQFINWVPYCYRASLKVLDPSVQNLIVGRCWRFLKETADLIITPDIERSCDTEEIEKKNEFAVGVIFAFNKLLKRTYDEKQLSHFGDFVKVLNSLFEHYESYVKLRQPEARQIEWRLANQELSAQQRGLLERDLNLRKKHTWVVKKLNQSKSLVLYGLNAWFLRHYDRGSLALEHFREWHGCIPSFGNLQETWQLYLDATERETEKDFGWDWWELREHPEGTTVTIGFDRYLQLLCCLRYLELIKGMTSEQRKKSTLPQSPEIIHLGEKEESPFRKILNDFRQESDKWRPLLGDEGIAAIPAFEDMLAKAVSAQKDEEVSVLIAAPLWDEKIEEVKRNILTKWNENAQVRHIVKEFGIYEYIPTPAEGKDLFGINVLDTKDVYVKESRVSSHGWGEAYGRSVADGESESVLNKILAALPLIVNSPVSHNQIVKSVDEALAKLETAGYKPIILILNSWLASRTLETSEGFSHSDESKGRPGFGGYYKIRPVFNLYYGESPIVTVVDLKRLGIWRQFKPKQVMPEEEYINDELIFCIRPVTEEYARELIHTRPQFGRDEHGNERPEEAVLTELQQRVRFRLLEQFEFDVLDNNAGYKIPVVSDV